MKTKERTTRMMARLPLFLMAGLVVLGLGLSAQPALAFCAGGAPDGFVDTGEDCDDGNLINGDGCTFDCVLEPNCVDDVTGRTNVCTANDVNLGLVLNSADVACELGTTVDLELTALLQATSAERWDIGIFVALDGGTARVGSCYQDYLRPPLAAGGTCSVTGETCTNYLTDPGLSGCPAEGLCDDGVTGCNTSYECPAPAGGGTCLVTGDACFTTADCADGDICIGVCTGGQVCDGGYCPCDGTIPYYNGEDDVDPLDTCGDLEQNVDTYYDFVDADGVTPLTITVPCQDNYGFCQGSGKPCDVATNDGCTGSDICIGDGKVDFGSCVSWDNARSDEGTGGNKPACTSKGDAVPNTKSKCRCETQNVGNVYVAGKIIVEKVCDPSTETQEFAFTSNFNFKADPDDVVGAPDPSLACGDTAESVPLEPSEISSFDYSVVEDTAPAGWYFEGVECTSDKTTDPIVNTAIDLQSGETVTCVFTNIEPNISIDKDTAALLTKTGDEVTYNIQVCYGDWDDTLETCTGANTDGPALECSIEDSVVGDVTAEALAAGCTSNGDTLVLLTPNDVCMFDLDITVPDFDGPSFSNTAIADCTIVGESAAFSDTDTISVQEFTPAFGIVKTGDASSKVGDDVDYTFTLSNTSSANTPDLTCTATDDVLGVVFGPAVLPAGDTVVNKTRTVLAGDPNPLVNNVTLSCTLPAEFTNVLDDATDSHSVNLFAPAITFDKTGDLLSKIGDPTDYVITLNNTSSTNTPDLTCTVTDAAIGVNKTVTLASGASDTTNATAAIPADATDPYVNTASVSCSVAGFPNTLTDSDDHSVNLFAPAITFDKTGDLLSKIGDPTDYVITLNNTSSTDTPDLTCTVTDAAIGVNKTVTLASGASDTTNATAAIPADATDPYVNTASVSCSVAGFPNTLTDSDDHSVNLFAPAITFDKTGDLLSKIGDPTDYVITLNNTSSTDTPDLTCTVTDAAIGVNKTVTLASGASDTTNATAAIPADATDPYVNTASVSCSVAGFPNTLTDSDDHSVNLFAPAITFDKTGDLLSKIGDPTDYVITLNNTSSTDTPDLTCTVTDAAIGVNKTVTLASGASDTTNATAAIPADATDPYVNTASVSCSAAGFPNTLTDSDDHSVNLFAPAITFDKTGDLLSKIGDPTDYVITLNNTSSTDTPDLTCTVTDAAIGVNKTVTLASGASDTTNATAAIPADATDPYVNTASVSCSVAGFPNTLTDSDDHSVNLFAPAITFDKTGDLLSKIGDPTDYVITLNNTSSTDTPDLTCTVTDAAIGVNKTVTLASGASDTTNATAAIPADATDPYVNTASVSCSVAGFPNTLTDSDDHSVNLFAPAITFDKTGDLLSKIGDPTDYVITLNNTSSTDTPDLTCTVTDAAIGVNKTVTLASGASDTTNATAAIPADATDPYVNTASVSCSAAGFPNTLTDSDDHSVNLFAPAITFAKTGDARSKVGDAVDYTITLNNTSSTDTPDLTCTVTDAAIGVNKTVTLASGASDTTNATKTMSAVPFTNTASVSCTVAGFPNVLSDDASHTVSAIDPRFTIAKSCTNEPVPQAGPATWDIRVTNIGDVALIVTVTDDLIPDPGYTTFSLAVGAIVDVAVSDPGTGENPFAGIASVSNTATASAVVDLSEGVFTNAISPASASDTCVVAGEAKIIKLTQGLPNEAPNPETRDWRFTLQDCGSGTACTKDSLVIAEVISPPSMVTFNADLVPVEFDPDQRYRICEVLIPVAWTNTWMGDATDDGTPETLIPFVPAVNDAPVGSLGWSNVFDPLYLPPPEIWTNDERCINFVANAGATEVFEINNEFPGGEPRTIGYWKNWDSCSGGGQVDTAIENCGPTSAERLSGGCALLDDVLQPPGITIGVLPLVADDDVFACDQGTEDARNILDKRSIDDGKKRASDAAYALASQLLAAIANDTAGAGVCPEAGQAVIDGQNLLVAIGFDGTGSYFKGKKKIAGFSGSDANELAGILDSYNNGTLCVP